MFTRFSIHLYWSILLPGLFLIFIAATQNASGQGLPMATAELVCGADDNPAQFRKALTGVFSRADSILFNSDCDRIESFPRATVQELGNAFAISGPFAQATATANVIIQLSPETDCQSQSGTNGFGGKETRSVITFSVALAENRTPPFRPSFIPGNGLLSGQLRVKVDPPDEEFEDFETSATAAMAFFDAGGTALVSEMIEIGNGEDVLGIDSRPFSFSFLTNGERQEFSKAALALVEASAVEGCDGIRVEAFAEAIIDPVFQFDQTAFDLEHGVNTFDLASFYEIQMSPNLGVLLLADGFE